LADRLAVGLDEVHPQHGRAMRELRPVRKFA
jgi:hypothetical protein